METKDRAFEVFPAEYWRGNNRTLRQFREEYPRLFCSTELTAFWPKGWSPHVRDACEILTQSHPGAFWIRIEFCDGNLILDYSNLPLSIMEWRPPELRDLTIAELEERLDFCREKVTEIEAFAAKSCINCGKSRMGFTLMTHFPMCRSCIDDIPRPLLGRRS